MPIANITKPVMIAISRRGAFKKRIKNATGTSKSDAMEVNAAKGVAFLFTPDWKKLADPNVY
ncbi:hypothetical protein N9452_10795, partial [Alphaproteobacteria bacterium]|nr:hypothetical protein [Alphaproteobacteria bacterium]